MSRRRFRRPQPVLAWSGVSHVPPDTPEDAFPTAGASLFDATFPGAPRSVVRRLLDLDSPESRFLGGIGGVAPDASLRSPTVPRRRFARPLPPARLPLIASRLAKARIAQFERSWREFRLLPRLSPNDKACIRRRVRKQVLFASRVAGRKRSPGRGGTYHRKLDSLYRC